jgi:hypothetical protein
MMRELTAMSKDRRSAGLVQSLGCGHEGVIWDKQVRWQTRLTSKQGRQYSKRGLELFGTYAANVLDPRICAGLLGGRSNLGLCSVRIVWTCDDVPTGNFGLGQVERRPRHSMARVGPNEGRSAVGHVPRGLLGKREALKTGRSTSASCLCLKWPRCGPQLEVREKFCQD